MKTRWSMIAVLLSALLVSACGGPTATPATEAKPPAVGGVPTPTPTATPSSSNNPAAPLQVTNLTDGLDTLTSYQASWSLEVEAQVAGQAKSLSSFAGRIDSSQNPLANYSQGTNVGTNNHGWSDWEFWQTADKTYIKSGSTCSLTTSKSLPPLTEIQQLEQMIGSMKLSTFYGNENVDGIPAEHYSVDVSEFGTPPGNYTNAKSDVWIASNGKFVVKYAFIGDGKDQFFGNPGTDDTTKLTYELISVNKSFTITPPANCGQPSTGLPILPDATGNSDLGGGMTGYTTATAAKDAIAFYKTQMAAAGWIENPGGEATIDNSTTLAFTKAARTASVTITPNPSNQTSTILIILTP